LEREQTAFRNHRPRSRQRLNRDRPVLGLFRRGTNRCTQVLSPCSPALVRCLRIEQATRPRSGRIGYEKRPIGLMERRLGAVGRQSPHGNVCRESRRGASCASVRRGLERLDQGDQRLGPNLVISGSDGALRAPLAYVHVRLARGVDPPAHPPARMALNVRGSAHGVFKNHVHCWRPHRAANPCAASLFEMGPHPLVEPHAVPT